MAKSPMAGKRKSGGKKHHPKVKEMHIKPGASGGYIVRHDQEPDMDDQGGGGMPQQQEPPQFAVGNQAALMSHIQQHMPEEGGEGQQ